MRRLKALNSLARSWWDWWDYIRYQYPERLLVLGVLLAIALGLAGYASASAMTRAAGPAGGNVRVTTRVVRSMRTVRVTQTATLVETRRVKAPTRTRIVTQHVLSRPVYRSKTVLAPAKTVTIIGAAGRQRTRTVVQRRTKTVTIPSPVQTLTDTVTATVTVTTGKHHH